MSPHDDNCAKLRRLYEAFEGRAVTEELLADTFDPDVEFNPMAHRDAGGRTYRGRDGMLAFFGELGDELGEIRYEMPDFHPVGEAVIAFTQIAGTARDTSLPFHQDLAIVYEFADGLVTCVTGYETPAEALKAVERGHADA